MTMAQTTARLGGAATPDALDDEKLMQRVRAGEKRAFDLLYERHAGAAYSFAYRMVGAAGAAEDVTQEAFVSAWRASASYDPARGSVRTWLLGIVHHRAIDALRRSRRRERREVNGEGIVEHLESPQRTDEQVERRADAGVLRVLLGDLCEAQREVLELAYGGGLTQKEIADQLGTPLGTIKGRMRLGLQKLRLAHSVCGSVQNV